MSVGSYTLVSPSCVLDRGAQKHFKRRVALVEAFPSPQRSPWLDTLIMILKQ